MKLLFDQNISFRIKKKLQHIFSDFKHVSDCSLLDSEDRLIWEYSKQKGFAIVTFDSDFFEISLINGHPPKIVWIRTSNLTANDIAHMMTKNITEISSFLENVKEQDLACMELEFYIV